MYTSLNTNIMASNTARNLNSHYANLATSTQRLSSGLRINSSADDAAGLAIRELMRADIAAFHQGARNANDAISMLQVADGALAIIDEKLIRMKELAEQAATGTYDSTQRLMIDSEFQAMASEIQRIAVATDFNGIKLLNGSYVQNIDNIQQTRIVEENLTPFIDNVRIEHFGSIGQSASIKSIEYNITNPEALAGSCGIDTGDNKTSAMTFWNKNTNPMPSWDGKWYFPQIHGDMPMLPNNITNGLYEFNYDAASNTWSTTVDYGATLIGGDANGCQFDLNGKIIDIKMYDTDGNPAPLTDNITVYGVPNNPTNFSFNLRPDYTYNSPYTNNNNFNWESEFSKDNNEITFTLYFDDGMNSIQNKDQSITIKFDVTSGDCYDLTYFQIRWDIGWKNNVGPDNPEPIDPDTPTPPSNPVTNYGIPDNVVKIHFGTGNDSAEDYYYINKADCTIKGLGLDEVRVETQDNAQKALVTLNEAIVSKDKIRAYFGAMQNRLENTISNLNIQAENLQASESRISDVDVATEMTNFVRNQILTQSAVAMLGQANSMPQMLMQLIQ